MTAPRHDSTTTGRSRRSPQGLADYGHGLTFPEPTSSNSAYANYAQPRSSPDRLSYQAQAQYAAQWNYPPSSSVELMYPEQYDAHLHSAQAYPYERRELHSQPYQNMYPPSASSPVYAPVASYPHATEYIHSYTPRTDTYGAQSQTTYDPQSFAHAPSNSSQRGNAARPDPATASSSSARRRVTSTAAPYSPTHSDATEESTVVKKKRRKADAAQLKVLNEVWERTAFPSTEERAELARKLDMSPRSVQIWFQNRRQSMRQNMRQSGTVTSGSHQSFSMGGSVESPTEDLRIAGFNGYTSESTLSQSPSSMQILPNARTTTSTHSTLPSRSSISPSSSSHRSSSSRR